MPVPGNGFKGKMFVGRKVTLEYPEPDDGQHNGADGYMHAMETGQHKKG